MKVALNTYNTTQHQFHSTQQNPKKKETSMSVTGKFYSHKGQIAHRVGQNYPSVKSCLLKIGQQTGLTKNAHQSNLFSLRSDNTGLAKTRWEQKRTEGYVIVSRSSQDPELLNCVKFMRNFQKFISIGAFTSISVYTFVTKLHHLYHLRQPRVTIRVPLLSTLGGSRIHFEIRAQCHLVIYRSCAPQIVVIVSQSASFCYTYVGELKMAAPSE